MLIVKTHDGTTFTGTTATAILRQMRDTQWGVPQPKRSWKEDVADRVHQMTGEYPRLTPVQFLADLERLKLVTITVTPAPGATDGAPDPSPDPSSKGTV
jgi:hypothetical protein